MALVHNSQSGQTFASLLATKNFAKSVLWIGNGGLSLHNSGRT